ncbi:MAG: hypothetical protein WKI04_15075 [Ferruginibacter sp.]
MNANYALPVTELDINSIRERVYRGFPRTMSELQAALAIFFAQKDAIKSLVSNFEPLTQGNKKEINKYLDEFFAVTKKEKDIRRHFIDNARRD